MGIVGPCSSLLKSLRFLVDVILRLLPNAIGSAQIVGRITLRFNDLDVIGLRRADCNECQYYFSIRNAEPQIVKVSGTVKNEPV